MNAQQKKNGWFFNKNIIDEINSIPEDEIMLDESPNNPVEYAAKKWEAELTELKRLLSEKEVLIEQTGLEKQRLAKEKDKYKQALLRTGEEQAENRRQIQELKVELRRSHQENQRLKENKETGDLKEQLDQAEEEVASLREALGNYQTMETDHQEAQKRMDNLVNELNKKETLVRQLEQVIAEKDQMLLEKESLVEQAIEDQKTVVESEFISKLQHQITTLQTENEQLKQEAIQSQYEIGEVLISARRQANRMVEKAKMEAQRIVKDSEAELQTIHDRAKEISCEVDESRETVLSIYEELKSRVEDLAQSNVPDLEEIKGRYE